MSNRAKNAKLKLLKEELAKKERLLRNAQKIDETSGIAHLRSLLEGNDLDQAKLILASQDVIEKLQKIAERLAELNAEEVMPLSDSMKAAFGPDMAHQFEHVASESIQKALEAVRGAKDAIDNAVLQVEGKIAPGSDNDMASYDDQNADATMGDENPAPATDAAPADDAGQAAPEDSILATDTGAENPLGREQKESINYSTTGKKILESTSIDSLVSWIMNDARSRLSESSLRTFAINLEEKMKKDPYAVAGWISSKKKIAESKILESKSLKIAEAIAAVIEANVSNFGNGKAAAVVNQFTQNGLTEDQTNNVLKVFNETYGCTPAVYSAKAKMKMKEDAPTDTGSIASGSTTTSNPSDTDSTDAPPGASVQDDAENAAVAKIAKNVASNPSSLNEPVSTATSDLSAQEKSAVNSKISQVASKTGDASMTVKDLLQDTDSDGVNENINEPKWPTNSQGQYKGNPLETDYGKLKAKTGEPKAEGPKKPKAEKGTDTSENTSSDNKFVTKSSEPATNKDGEDEIVNDTKPVSKKEDEQ